MDLKNIMLALEDGFFLFEQHDSFHIPIAAV